MKVRRVKVPTCLPVREGIEKEQEDAATDGPVTMTLPHTTTLAFSHINRALTSDSSSVTALMDHVFNNLRVTGAEGGLGIRAREQH